MIEILQTTIGILLISIILVTFGLFVCFLSYLIKLEIHMRKFKKFLEKLDEDEKENLSI